MQRSVACKQHAHQEHVGAPSGAMPSEYRALRASRFLRCSPDAMLAARACSTQSPQELPVKGKAHSR